MDEFLGGVFCHVFMSMDCCLKDMRGVRKELLKLCEHRMRSHDTGNVDAFIILINCLKRANNVTKLPKKKRADGRFSNDCLDAMIQKVELLKGRAGAARIIYGQFSGRSASVLHRRLSKQFDDVINAANPPLRSSPLLRSNASNAQRASAQENRVTWFNRVRGRGFDPQKDVCFRCGKVGHMSRDCALKAEPSS